MQFGQKIVILRLDDFIEFLDAVEAAFDENYSEIKCEKFKTGFRSALSTAKKAAQTIAFETLEITPDS